MNFSVATNAEYRRYSKLAFSSTITAANSGTSKSATINVTAQALPVVTMITPRSDRSGAVCDSSAEGILFNCPLGTAACTFKQECTLGCETRRLSGSTYKDVCATTGVVPVVMVPKRIIGGTQGTGTLQLSSAAPADSFGKVANTLFTTLATNEGLNIPIATGTTSVPFAVNTIAVTSVAFVSINGWVVTPIVSSSGTFCQNRSARAWLILAPPPL